jgi:hypothetical protein
MRCNSSTVPAAVSSARFYKKSLTNPREDVKIWSESEDLPLIVEVIQQAFGIKGEVYFLIENLHFISFFRNCFTVSELIYCLTSFKLK